MKDKLNQPIQINITSGLIVKIIVILTLAYLVFLLKDLAFILLTAVVIASAVEPASKALMKKGIPRPLSVIILYLSFILVFTGVATLILPPLAQDVKSLISTIPNYIETVSSQELENIPGLSLLFDQFAFSPDLIAEQFSAYAGKATFGFFEVAGTIFGGIFSFILIFVISFYLSVQNDGVASFLRVITPLKHEPYVLDLWRRSQRKIGLWMQGQLLLGVIVGTLTYIGLTILGIQNALLFALIAALFELIPIFGPILAAIPAIGMALIQDGFALALIVTGLYIIIQQFETHLIYPLVVKKIVGIPSLLAIVALIVGAQLAGFLGMIVSVPIAAALMEYLTDVEKRKAKELEKMNLGVH